MAAYAPSSCPMCGERRLLDHELHVRWRTAPWETSPHSSDAHGDQGTWLAVCAECSSSAALFRVDYPRQVEQHKRDMLRLVIVFGIALILLMAILWVGKQLIHSDPPEFKILYGASWLILGIVTIYLILYSARVVGFELANRKEWAAPWIEDRIAKAVGLPKGDQSPYWWEIKLEESLESRIRQVEIAEAIEPSSGSLQAPKLRLGPTPGWPSATEW